MSTARHHHYIPQCYLKRFTQTGRKDSPFHVFDLIRRRMYPTVPRNVGGERDFNRIEVSGLAPDAIEKAMSGLESEFDRALAAVVANPDWSPEDRNLLMNLMALMVVRSPSAREWRRQPIDQLAKMTAQMLLDSRESWEHIGPRENGELVVPYDAMKRFVDEEAYRIMVSNEQHILDETELVGHLLPYLAERQWGRIVATAESGLFVTSNKPVVLEWKDPKRIPERHRHHVGFGLPDTVVHFALSPTLAMMGTFDGVEEVIESSPRLTAGLNASTLRHADGMVFSQQPTIAMVDRRTGLPRLFGDQDLFR